MEMAINQEKAAAENLRALVTLTVQAGAGGNNLTEARRASIIISQRQALFMSRKNLIFVKYFVTDGLAVAHDAIGGQSVDDLLSNEDKKRIEESRKKKGPETVSTPDAMSLFNLFQAAQSGSSMKRDGPNLLNMMAAGNSRPKIRRDKTNSPCFAC